MLVVAGLILGQVKFFLVEVVENLSLHSKQLELGKEVLRYSIPDRIMTLSEPTGNLKWDPARISRHCLTFNIHSVLAPEHSK